MIATAAATAATLTAPLANGEPSLTPRQAQQLKAMLKHEQRDLRSRIAANEGAQQALGMAQAEEGGPGSAPGDVAGDLAEETLVATLVRADRTRLADVEAALYRIAAHQYGRCVTCGHPIGYARLYVLPWTSRCRVCAGRMRTGAHDTRDAATH